MKTPVEWERQLAVWERAPDVGLEAGRLLNMPPPHNADKRYDSGLERGV